MNSGKKERKTSHYIFTNWNLIIFQNLERINRNMWKQKWSNIMHDTQFTDLTTVYLKLILFQIILTTSHNRGKMLQYYLPSTWLYAPWSIRRLQEMFKWFESFFFFFEKNSINDQFKKKTVRSQFCHRELGSGIFVLVCLVQS